MTSEVNQQLRFAVQKLARRIRASSADEELSEAQRSVLFTLAHHGTQSLGSLSEHEQVTPPTMTRTVSALVSSGHVLSSSAEDDARRLEIGLSEKGEAFIEETRRRRDAWFTKQLGGLSAEQRRILELATPILKELAES